MLVARRSSCKTLYMSVAAGLALALAGCTGKEPAPALLAQPPGLSPLAEAPLVVKPISQADAGQLDNTSVVAIRPAIADAPLSDAHIVNASFEEGDAALAPAQARSTMVVPRPRPANLMVAYGGTHTQTSAVTVANIEGELKPAIVEAASSQEANPHPVGSSAWCRYLEATAQAKRAILLSPTISGSVDNETNASAKISYDVVDIARAGLEEEAAAARCARFDAAGRIQRMLFITPQSLTYAGNLAKANYLRDASLELQSISSRINAHVRNGEMTAQLAAGLNQYIETVRSQEHRARAEAHRRETVGLLDAGDVRGLDVKLTEAERALAQVDRMSRTLEAVSVNLTAGIDRNTNNGISNRDSSDFFDRDSAYAQVTVSYRLGAISPQRRKYERLAEQARVDALSEDGRGTLWRTSEMAAALTRARSGLAIQRDRIASALEEARINSRKFSSGYEIELNQSKYRAQIDVIKLTAELRGLEGTLNDIDKVEQNLNFQ